MRHYLPALLLTLAIPWAHAQDPQLRLARYSSAATTPDLADYAPLETIATLNFPAEVGTVGEALHYTLLRTGYTLGHTDADATHLLALPLPHSHRALGPARVNDLLTILVGPSYAVAANPVDRTIAIGLASAPKPIAVAIPEAQTPLVEPAPAASEVAAAAKMTAPSDVVSADTQPTDAGTPLASAFMRAEVVGP